VTDLLPSWSPGPTRDAVVAFLGAATDLAVERRVAVFDNDGTLWTERPRYAQLDFFVSELRRAVDRDPSLATRPEYAAVLSGEAGAIEGIGLARVALALAELCAGLEPEEFAERCRRFLYGTPHPALAGRPYAAAVYQPMLELLDELRARRFSLFVLTGGGTEFVRAVSQDLYGVPPEGVVGTLIAYEVERGEGGRLRLLRTAEVLGGANEGETKVLQLQGALGRRPVLAAGNSAGDREMIEYTTSGPAPTLGLLVDHDDGEREAAYASVAATFESAEPITHVARRLGWTVVSMRHDWRTVFEAGP
jgi:phosphoserine phosphatase